MANLRSIFRSIDTANAGYIDKSDIGRLLQALEPSATVTQNDVLFVINEVDLTHDQRLSFVEFRKWYLRARKVRTPACVGCGVRTRHAADVSSVRVRHPPGVRGLSTVAGSCTHVCRPVRMPLASLGIVRGVCVVSATACVGWSLGRARSTGSPRLAVQQAVGEGPGGQGPHQQLRLAQQGVHIWLRHPTGRERRQGGCVAATRSPTSHRSVRSSTRACGTPVCCAAVAVIVM